MYLASLFQQIKMAEGPEEGATTTAIMTSMKTALDVTQLNRSPTASTSLRDSALK